MARPAGRRQTSSGAAVSPFRFSKLSGPIFAKLGSPRSGAPFVTSADIPHALICAPTGSGKGVGIVIPTLLTYGGSIICLDVKGENFAATSRHRVAMSRPRVQVRTL